MILLKAFYSNLVLTTLDLGDNNIGALLLLLYFLLFFPITDPHRCNSLIRDFVGDGSVRALSYLLSTNTTLTDLFLDKCLITAQGCLEMLDVFHTAPTERY